jgi:hypothetical protein
MASILDELRSQLSGPTAEAIGQKIGANPDQTKRAIDTALPVLVAALGKEATDPNRSAGLHQALADDHDGSIVNNLEAYLAGASNGKATDGSGILDHILGGQQQAAVQGVSEHSGLDASSIASLLPLLAPIVMGLLGQKKRNGADVTNELQQGTQQAAAESPDLGALLGSVLGGQGSGQGGLGDVLGSILGRG